MPHFENSEVVRHVLQTLINISSRKTTKGQAASTMNELIKKLQEKYDFLKHIEIKDIRFMETDEPVRVVGPFFRVKGDGLYVDLRRNKYVVKENVSTTVMGEVFDR